MEFNLYGPAFTEADMNAYIFGEYVVYDKSDKVGYYTKLSPIGAQNLLKSQHDNWRDLIVIQQKVVAKNVK